MCGDEIYKWGACETNEMSKKEIVFKVLKKNLLKTGTIVANIVENGSTFNYRKERITVTVMTQIKSTKCKFK